MRLVWYLRGFTHVVEHFFHRGKLRQEIGGQTHAPTAGARMHYVLCTCYDETCRQLPAVNQQL